MGVNLGVLLEVSSSTAPFLTFKDGTPDGDGYLCIPRGKIFTYRNGSGTFSLTWNIGLCDLVAQEEIQEIQWIQWIQENEHCS